MTMSKEMERLKSKIELYKGLINLFDALNFIYKSNKYDKIIKEYQNELSKIYKYYYYDDKGNKVFLNGDEDLCIINDTYYISIEVKK